MVKTDAILPTGMQNDLVQAMAQAGFNVRSIPLVMENLRRKSEGHGISWEGHSCGLQQRHYLRLGWCWT